MNNFKTVFSFNNEKITIVLFNNVLEQTNILFYKSVTLAPKTINNGYIANNEEVNKIINELLQEAKSFINKPISEVYVSVDCNEISIKPLELSEVKLSDGILDENVWNSLANESIKINQITDKYIYDVRYVSWKVDGNEYYELSDNPIAGNSLIIKAIIYQINKILYQNYERIFLKNNVQMLSLLPMVNTFSDLIQKTNKDNYEIFVYLNDDALVIAQTSGKNIQECVHDQDLGLNKLYDVVAKTNNLDIDIVKNIFNTNIIFNNDCNFEIFNGYDEQGFKLKESSFNVFKSILDDFVSSIANVVDINIKFLENKRHLKINKVSYIPINKLTSNIINLTKMHSNSSTFFYQDDDLKDYDENGIQTSLMIKYLIHHPHQEQMLKNNYSINEKYNKKDANKK